MTSIAVRASIKARASAPKCGLRRVLLLTACPLAFAASGLTARAQTAAPATATPATSAVPTTHANLPASSGSAAVGASSTTRPSGSRAASRNTSGAGASGETVIVTGTRSLGRKARDSTSPIDVITGATLRRSGQPNLAQQLQVTNPAINIQSMGQDTAALTATIRLRGLNPNDTLILLDGVRRHYSANIAADGGPEQGSVAPDLNMIPAASIDHIEVLRDGAAAQYGSDAIAGVVNVITKKNAGFDASAQSGANAANNDSNGWLYQLDADGGTTFGNDGYIHVGGQMYHRDIFVVRTTDDRAAADGFPPNSNNILGAPEETRETLSLEGGDTIVPDLWGGLQAYGLITYGHRHAEAYENYRTPSVLPEVYPAGFSPRETDEENDYAATLGLRADDFLGFHVDLSSTYGADELDIGNKDTANPTLYTNPNELEPTDPDFGIAPGFTPTTVLAQSMRSAQWTNDLNFTRPFSFMGHAMNLAFGAEHRLDDYQLGAGVGPSWEVGGTQGFAGLRPQNAGEWYRDVYAGYIDLDTHPLTHWDLDFAGRFEHYTDFGNTEAGKISSRYDFTRWLAVRGTISNGLRAPTLAEEHFSSLNVSPTGATGALATDSAAARSIGAVPLKPERSTNVSGGIVLQPMRNLSATVDVYQINIRDRIVGANGPNGQAALNAIALTGATLPAGTLDLNNISTSYFANGASTRTQGLDIDVNYFTDFRNRGWGTVSWTLGLDLNRTRVDHTGINSQGDPFLTAQGVSWLTGANPRSKLILNGFWRLGKFDLNARETRWGETVDDVQYQDLAPAALAFSNTTFYQFTQTPVWTTDLEAGYQISHHWHVAVGGDNIFNMQPRRMPADTSYLNVQYYDVTSAQIPITGGFYYGRVNYVF